MSIKYTEPRYTQFHEPSGTIQCPQENIIQQYSYEYAHIYKGFGFVKVILSIKTGSL